MKTKPTTPKDLMDEVPSANVLTYATVCSGIECMSVASWGLPLKPIFFSEIEPFPCAVLKAHYPDVPNLGDMSKISVTNKTEITNGTVRIVLDRPLDILAGGTPCQDVSVAGKRAGMQEGSGTRSSLAFDFVRLARELGPRYIIWENVAGAIDSKNAPDFLAFLRALGECGYSLAWRVLDAQYVRVDGMERAVPQRRRRVWVVGCLGADESVPAKILFEPDCITGHTPPRRRTGQGFAYSLARRDSIHAGMVDDAPGAGVEGSDGGIIGTINYLGNKGCAGASTDNISPTLSRPSGSDSHVVALDGDKLKPREDRHGVAYGIDQQGGKGGANATEGVAPTVLSDSHGTPHGVAYAADGGEVAATITRQISEQSGQDNHAQDSRVQGPIDTAPTQGSSNANSAGVSGNNPLVVHTQTPFVKTAHAKGKDGDGEKWEQCEIVGARNTFDNGEKRCQECIVSTNSNGEDVAATLTQDLAKQTGNQQQNGGGYVVTRNLSALGATCSTAERTPPSPPTSASASSRPSPQEPRKAQSAQN